MTQQRLETSANYWRAVVEEQSQVIRALRQALMQAERVLEGVTAKTPPAERWLLPAAGETLGTIRAVLQ